MTYKKFDKMTHKEADIYTNSRNFKKGKYFNKMADIQTKSQIFEQNGRYLNKKPNI